MGEPVAVADDETVEDVLGVQARVQARPGGRLRDAVGGRPPLPAGRPRRAGRRRRASRSKGRTSAGRPSSAAAPAPVAGSARLPPQVVVAPVLGRPAVDRPAPAGRRPAAARGRRRRAAAEPASSAASRSQGAEPTRVGADPEGAAAVVGPVPAGPVLLGRCACGLGRRPRPAGRLLRRASSAGGSAGRVLELDGDADVAAELLGQRLGEHPAHPGLEHGLGELVGRGQHRGVLDQAQRAGQVQHGVLLRGQAGRQPLADLVPDRRQVQRGIGHAGRSSPCCRPRGRRPSCRRIAPGVRRIRPGWSARRCGRLDALFHTSVHRLCTAGDGLAGAARSRQPDRHLCWSRRRSGGRRAVRRSADRRGRPARRDPDVRRGATATLTAPSTARQRSAGPSRARRHASSPACRPAGAVPVQTMGGRVRPGRRRSRDSSAMLVGVCGRSCRPCRAPRGAVASRSAGPASGGHRGGVRAVPPAPRARPPAGGCAPPMSCSGSTS